jgi:YVTN family beta-propeller protein
VPDNWQKYSTTESSQWNPVFPPAPILQYDAAGKPVLVPNLDAYYDSKFDYPRELPALTPPKTPGVGEVWIDTQMEEYAGKDYVGAATKINVENWTIDRKISGSSINMNNPHNMWTDKNYQYLYQTEWFDDELSVFDRATGQHVRTIEVGPDPSHVMTRTDTDQVQVAINGGTDVVELSPGATKIDRRIPVGPPGEAPQHPHAFWLSGDGKTTVTPNVNPYDASVVDNDTGTYRKEPTGELPIASSMTPDQSKFYMADFLGASVSCVSLAEDACVKEGKKVHNASIDLWENYDPVTGRNGDKPWGGLTIQLPVSPDGKAMLAANTLSASVSVIDPKTDKVVKQLSCNAGCHGINFGAKKGGGYYAYVSNKFSNAAQVIDIDPNGDGDISDAAIAGQLVLEPTSVTKLDGSLTGEAGFGGQGVLAIPLVYNGWSQQVPAGWREKLTPEQLNPIG